MWQEYENKIFFSTSTRTTWLPERYQGNIVFLVIIFSFSWLCSVNIYLPVIIVETVNWLNYRQNIKRIDWYWVLFDHHVRRRRPRAYEIFLRWGNDHVITEARIKYRAFIKNHFSTDSHRARRVSPRGVS